MLGIRCLLPPRINLSQDLDVRGGGEGVGTPLLWKLVDNSQSLS